MAIQLRRGVYADFDPTKLMPGEFAVVTEDDPDGDGGQAIYMCFGSGVVKRLIEYADVEDMLAVPIALGQGTRAIIESDATSAGGNNSHAEGYHTVASGNYSHAEGNGTTSSGEHSHSEGRDNTASGAISHAEGWGTSATGQTSHTEGYQTVASYANSHAEGYQSKAIYTDAHAEGYKTTASEYAAHAEGYETTASGYVSHVEGYQCTASGYYAHAEGMITTADARAAHSEGQNTESSGLASHTEGYSTKATHRSQHVFGEFNVLDPSQNQYDSRGTYVEIVGKGTAGTSRSNARTLDWSGNEVLAGKLTVGAAPTADMDVATKQYVDNTVAGLSQVEFTDPNDDGNIVISFT